MTPPATTPPQPAGPWARARAALALLAVDPAGLGGLWLRGRAGPVRDLVTAALSLPLPQRRIAPTIADDALFGGLDLAATLAGGRSVASRALLADPAALVLAMAERAPPGLAARLAVALDAGRHTLIALDEAADEGEGLAGALADRLALFLDLEGMVWSEAEPLAPDAAAVAEARDRLAATTVAPDGQAALARLAAALAVRSLRVPILAARAARAAAALAGRAVASEDDLRLAAELVLAHRGVLPPEAEAEPPEPPPPEPPADAPPDDTPEADADGPDRLPDEILLDAVRAALPADLLDRLAAGRAARAAAGAAGTGAEQRGNRRGRPLPSRPGRPGGDARLDLVATLRTAAPWQPLRAPVPGAPEGRLRIRPQDFRLRRYRQTSDRVLIFVVDASGSAALARLAEAKGAVELLLARAYARRDHVALVAFRGRAAELLLPPTRSLVQTKRRLAALPGGGGTPLAAGLRMGLDLAEHARSRGMTPTLALLTDGRGNIALDGTADRGQAEADAASVARAIRARAIPALVIDTATRPQAGLRTLAGLLDAPYLALPRADARRLDAVLSAGLGP
jgi:magnesium chelatase subunit D